MKIWWNPTQRTLCHLYVFLYVQEITGDFGAAASVTHWQSTGQIREIWRWSCTSGSPCLHRIGNSVAPVRRCRAGSCWVPPPTTHQHSSSAKQTPQPHDFVTPCLLADRPSRTPCNSTSSGSYGRHTHDPFAWRHCNKRTDPSNIFEVTGRKTQTSFHFLPVGWLHVSGHVTAGTAHISECVLTDTKVTEQWRQRRNVAVFSHFVEFCWISPDFDWIFGWDEHLATPTGLCETTLNQANITWRKITLFGIKILFSSGKALYLNKDIFPLTSISVLLKLLKEGNRTCLRFL